MEQSQTSCLQQMYMTRVDGSDSLAALETPTELRIFHAPNVGWDGSSLINANLGIDNVELPDREMIFPGAPQARHC